MVSFFSRGPKRGEYQGFSRYQEQISRDNGMVAGLPALGIPRNQSFSNGAGQAAIAALRLHSEPNKAPANRMPRLPTSPKPVHNHVQRSNSLATSQRSNSLRTYIYHPKGSYATGPQSSSAAAAAAASSHVARSNSLSSHSSRNKPPAARRASSFNPLQESYEETDEVEEVVTTKTTKVVDSQGRVQSIKTTTIRTLPDGSNVIETTTKNISRPGSRANSFTSSARNGSMLSVDNPVNLSKIDEDLHDFEYNYQLDNSNKLKLNRANEPIREEEFEENAAILQSYEETSQSPPKKLRSILKDTPQPVFEDAPDGSATNGSPHPYKAIPNEPLEAPPKLSVPSSPPTSFQQLNQRSPARKHDVLSSGSTASSIKFDDKVETIPIYNKGLGKPFSPVRSTAKPKKAPATDADMYAAAMEAAYKKVYGENADVSQANSPVAAARNSETNDSITQLYQPVSPRGNGRSFSLTSSVPSFNKKPKTSTDGRTLQEIGGVNTGFNYGNHHKDFVKHSLREQLPKSSTRKERSKEEKKLLKDLQAERENEAKRAKKEAKLQQKNSKKEKKSSPENNKFLSLFNRRKSSAAEPPVDSTEPPRASMEESFAPLEEAHGPEGSNTEPQTKEVDQTGLVHGIRPDLGTSAVGANAVSPELTTPKQAVVNTTPKQQVPAIITTPTQPEAAINSTPKFSAPAVNTTPKLGPPEVEESNALRELQQNSQPEATSRTLEPNIETAEQISPSVEPVSNEPIPKDSEAKSPTSKFKESNQINTTSSSPYLSASSNHDGSIPHDDDLDNVTGTIEPPKLSKIDSDNDEFFDDDDEEEEEVLNKIEASYLKPVEKPAAESYKSPEIQADKYSTVNPDSNLQLDYEAAAAYINTDDITVSAREADEKLPVERFELPATEVDQTPASNELPTESNGTIIPTTTKPVIVNEVPKEVDSPVVHDDPVVHNDPVSAPIEEAPLQSKPVHTVSDVGETRECPSQSVSIQPPRVGNAESAGDDKSTVPTVATGESDQPTNSTVATDHQQQGQPVEGPETLEGEEATKSKGKTKKPSRFKQKVLKLFVNNYDNQSAK